MEYFTDLTAQRRLRHAQTQRRAAEVQIFGHGEKVSQVSQLHAFQV